MNLFRVDFIQGKTDAVDYLQIKHSLVDYEGERAIMSLSISPEKLQSVSNYAGTTAPGIRMFYHRLDR